MKLTDEAKHRYFAGADFYVVECGEIEYNNSV